jgi:4-amino-4-deoxy-L-arabinose transferase-like glycosyltransferase
MNNLVRNTYDRHPLFGYLFIFILIEAVRLCFTLIYPLGSFDFFPTDSHEYVKLADNLLSGNFNFDIGRFIRSPGYPFFIAIHKLLFGAQWQHLLIVSQVLMSGITGLYLCLMANQLFQKRLVVLLTGILYAFYLPVFYYVYSFTSETLYLFFNVASMYYLIHLLQRYRIKYLAGWALFFSLAFLTRSEIMLFGPFAIVLLFCCYSKHPLLALRTTAIAIAIWFLLTLPWALVNLQHPSLVHYLK